MFQDRRAFHTGVNTYVPAQQYAAELVHGQPTEFSLGTPAAVSANNIGAAVAANSVANTQTAIAFPTTGVADSRYGRSLRLSISGDPGNACVHDVYGFDYLGQPMVERFTGASGVTAILYGKKAFYRVAFLKTITPASNAVTYNVGTGFRLGLPYKGDLAYAKENGVQIPIYKRDTNFEVSRPAALAVAGGSVFVRPPFPGFVNSLYGFSYGAGSTNNPVITVKLATVAITGLTVTIDDDVSTTAAVVTDTPTTIGYNANNRFIASDVIEIAGAAAASAAGDTVGLVLTPTHFLLPDLTDPQTNLTGDPRGTYEGIMVYDGAKEVRVGLVGDPWTNSSGNGGLHGLRHPTS